VSVCLFVCMCSSIYLCVSVSAHMCMSVCMYKYTFVHLCMCTHVCASIRVCVPVCFCVHADRNNQSPNSQFSLKKITLSLEAACQTVRSFSYSYLLAKFHNSVYLCDLKMSEVFVFLLKQIINWMFIQGACVLVTAIHFSFTFKTSHACSASLNL
jgi:hypothetical protein